jgi:hypothetical protein
LRSLNGDAVTAASFIDAADGSDFFDQTSKHDDDLESIPRLRAS